MTNEDNTSDASLLAVFMKFNELDATREERENAAWANDVIDDLVERAPEDAWRIILAVIEKDTNRRSIPMFAAGALEDLMSRHGEAFIDRVEAMNRQSPAFRWALGGVWKGGMSNELWERFQKIPCRPIW